MTSEISSHSPIGWAIEKAYDRGFYNGYQAGTEHMRRAYGNNQVGTQREEAQVGREEPDDARVQGDMARPDDREEICLHDGQEDASDCPQAEAHHQPDAGRVTMYQVCNLGARGCPRRHQQMVVARFPPDFR